MVEEYFLNQSSGDMTRSIVLRMTIYEFELVGILNFGVKNLENDFGYQERFQVGSVVGTFEFGERIKYVSVEASALDVTPIVLEVNISAQLITLDSGFMTVNQIETTDGEYHTFAVGNTLVGIT